MGPLAKQLAPYFTVYAYDRRGRGDSGNTSPYAVEREIEDLEALVQEAGGSAFVYGASSGAALALDAANRLPGIRKLVLYEAPFIVDNSRPPLPHDFLTRLYDMVAADRRSEAVRAFLKLVGLPAILIAILRMMPPWPKLKAVAHTLPYDILIVQDNQQGNPLPAGRWRSVTAPTLVLDGGNSPAWMRHGMRALASVLSNAKALTLKGQTHMVNAKVQAPVLVEFFSARG
jgi:pimeloyl-ACP methyl ester carboxylesterase